MKSNLLKIFTTLLCVLCATSLIFVSCNNLTKKGKYTINAEFTGIPDGTIMELIPGPTHKLVEPILTAELSSGKVTFAGELDAPIGLYIKAQDVYGAVLVIVSPFETITLKSDAEYYEEDDGEYRLYNFNNVSISGSSLQDDYEEMMKPRIAAEKIADKDPKELLKEKGYDVSKMTQDSIDHVHFTIIESYFNNAWIDAVMSNKDTWWGPMMMLAQTAYFVRADKELDMYNSFSEVAKNSFYGKEVYKELFPYGGNGDKLPEFNVTDLNGEKVSFSDLRKGHKVIVLDFWASWCKPCRNEIPNFKKLYEKYSSLGLQIVSISIDENEGAWKKALEEEKLPWPNFLSREVSSLYNVVAVPTIIIMNEKGIMLADNLRGQELDDFLATKLK